MGWVAAAVGVMTALTGISGAGSQFVQEYQQTQLEYSDNLEKIRRRKFQTQQTLGATKARSENAGVLHTAGSTPAGYLETMESEFTKELKWMRKYADEAKRLGIRGAELNESARVFSSIGQGISTGASIYGMGG